MANKTRGPVGQAGPLTRARIILAARRLVEREGVDVLTMRRLADEIGTAPMSLYRHVSDKREVLVELLDVIARELTEGTLPQDPDPRQRLIKTALMAHQILAGNRWAVHALLAVEELPARVLRLSEHMFEAMDEAGLDAQTAVRTHAAIWHYTWGHLYFDHLAAASARVYEKQDPSTQDTYPALSRVMPAMAANRGQDSFSVGLAALVDGFFA